MGRTTAVISSYTLSHGIQQLQETYRLKSRGDWEGGKSNIGHFQLQTLTWDTTIARNSPPKVERRLGGWEEQHWSFPVTLSHMGYNKLQETHQLKLRVHWEGEKNNISHFQLHTRTWNTITARNSPAEVKGRLGGWEEQHWSFPVTP